MVEGAASKRTRSLSKSGQCSLLSELSALSNASTCASTELWLGRSMTEEEALRGARARQAAASRNLLSTSPPRECFDSARGYPTHITPGASTAVSHRSGNMHVRFPTPRPTESLASRMAQQRRQRSAARAQHRHRERKFERGCGVDGSEMTPSASWRDLASDRPDELLTLPDGSPLDAGGVLGGGVLGGVGSMCEAGFAHSPGPGGGEPLAACGAVVASGNVYGRCDYDVCGGTCGVCCCGGGGASRPSLALQDVVEEGAAENSWRGLRSWRGLAEESTDSMRAHAPDSLAPDSLASTQELSPEGFGLRPVTAKSGTEAEASAHSAGAAPSAVAASTTVSETTIGAVVRTAAVHLATWPPPATEVPSEVAGCCALESVTASTLPLATGAKGEAAVAVSVAGTARDKSADTTSSAAVPIDLVGAPSAVSTRVAAHAVSARATSAVLTAAAATGQTAVVACTLAPAATVVVPSLAAPSAAPPTAPPSATRRAGSAPLQDALGQVGGAVTSPQRSIAESAASIVASVLEGLPFYRPADAPPVPAPSTPPEQHVAVEARVDERWAPFWFGDDGGGSAGVAQR